MDRCHCHALKNSILPRIKLVSASPPCPTQRCYTSREFHLAHTTHIRIRKCRCLARPVDPARPSQSSAEARPRSPRRLLLRAEHAPRRGAGAIGFRVTKLAARVRYRATRLLPRTTCCHRGHRPWLLAGRRRVWRRRAASAAALVAGGEQQQFAWAYRLADENGTWVLQRRMPDGWQDLYAFTDRAAGGRSISKWRIICLNSSGLAIHARAGSPTPDPDDRYVDRNRELTIERADSASKSAPLATMSLWSCSRAGLGSPSHRAQPSPTVPGSGAQNSQKST